MAGVRVTYARKARESLGADVNLSNPSPYQTIITAYTSPITFPAQPRSGTVIEIHNNAGEFILLNCDIELQGAATDQLRINNGQHAVLMYLFQEDITQRYRLISGSVSGLTLQ